MNQKRLKSNMDSGTDIFKYPNEAYSSMTELVGQLKKEQEITDICSKHHLNINLLWDLFKAGARGYNNTQIAQKLGINRVTAQRYADSLRKVKESEFEKIFNYLSEKNKNAKRN